MSETLNNKNQLPDLQQVIAFPLAASQVAPVVGIGGVGGSGTRVVAALLRAAGISIGDDINVSLDNLWFTLMFKQNCILDIEDEDFDQRLRLFIAANSGNIPLSKQDRQYADEVCEKPRLQHDRQWLLERSASMAASASNLKKNSHWGWKEPNTHICIERLAQRLPKLKYIHVARNGLDMAFSNNLAQLEFWGGSPLYNLDTKTPQDALAYWCAAHRKIFAVAENLGERFLFLRYEDLCNDPRQHIAGLLDFVDIPANDTLLLELCKLVNPPGSIGRFRQHDISRFNSADVEYVSSLGFSVEHVSDTRIPKV